MNGFSLSESESIPLANAIEKIGQAVDSSFMATTALVTTKDNDRIWLDYKISKSMS